MGSNHTNGNNHSPFDVSFPLPRLRRAVHRVMCKHGSSPFYRKIDWINKVLRKLKHRGPISMREKDRIRKLINSWLDENTIIHDPDSDSEYKRKVMAEIKNDMDDEKRLTRGRAKEKNKQQKGESEDKKDIKMKKVTQNTQDENQENEIQIISVVHRKTRKMSTVAATPSQMNIKKEKENVGEEIDENSPDTIPPCPAAIPIPKAQKEILLIDLEEEEDLKPAVKLEKEIITIKEDQKKVEKAPEINSTLAGNNSQNLNQPVPVIMYPYYVQNPYQLAPNAYQSYPCPPMMPGVFNYFDSYSNCYQ